MNPWIEAMRLRTLPVSVAGVIMAAGYSMMASQHPEWLPWALCLTFAILAQISSNFANEYYDFKAGLDKPGREGPRRGVTEGDITPRQMLAATYFTLGVACLIGLSLIYWGGWWLIGAGVIIAIGALMYSAGPYPLSHHGLGEFAVIFFFGIIPVNLTVYIMTGVWSVSVVCGSLAAGLMGANVLVVNNYRDRDDDASVGKNTLAVIYGLKAMRRFYLLNGIIAIALVSPIWLMIGGWWLLIPSVWLLLFLAVWRMFCHRSGRALNPLLGMTALLMLLYCIGFTLTIFFT